MGYVKQLIAAPLFLVSLLFLANCILAFTSSSPAIDSGDRLIAGAQGVFALPVFLIALKLLRDGRRQIAGTSR